MIIAIVGTSKLMDDELDRVCCHIETIVRRLGDNDKIITGDAEGVDHAVRLWTPRAKLLVEKAETKRWNAIDGFKARNIRISRRADKVISISTKVKEEACYHCNKDHQRTGGCFTMKEAKKLNKETELIIV